MSRIKIITPGKAEGELKEMYNEIGSKRGGVSQVLQVHSLLPQTLRDHFNLYKTLMFKSKHTGLTRKFLEMLAVTVSVENECEYCKVHHSEPLQTQNKDDGLVDALWSKNWKRLEEILSEAECYALRLASKLTKEPQVISDNDIDQLTLHEFTDQQILQIVLVINYFNFVNRNVLALGVELEPDYQKSCK